MVLYSLMASSLFYIMAFLCNDIGAKILSHNYIYIVKFPITVVLLHILNHYKHQALNYGMEVDET